MVSSYMSAMQLVRHSDLFAAVPHSCLGNAFVTDFTAANGLQYFELPLAIPAFTISEIWHPRLDHDPAHQWFRTEVLELCWAVYPQNPLETRAEGR